MRLCAIMRNDGTSYNRYALLMTATTVSKLLICGRLLVTCIRSTAYVTNFSSSPSSLLRPCCSSWLAPHLNGSSPVQETWMLTEVLNSGSSLSVAPIQGASLITSHIAHLTWQSEGGLCWTSSEWVRLLTSPFLLTSHVLFDPANLPSKTQLLILDLLIIFLQLILLFIAYETSLSLVLPPEAIDPLSPADDSSAGIYSIFGD